MRHQLPNRRPNITMQTKWQGMPLTVTVGFDMMGSPKELFADAPGAIGHITSDACVLISIALQHGITPDQLSKSLARVPDMMAGGGATLPGSPIGAILEALG